MRNPNLAFDYGTFKKMSNDEKESIKNQILELYINQNLNKLEVYTILNTSGKSLDKIMTDLNIKKSRELINQQVVRDSLKKYGCTNPSCRKEANEKRKQTNLKKYGVENPYQCKELMEKAYLEKLGVNHPCKSKKIRDKIKQTNLERYGVEHVWQSSKIREKQEQTMLKKYGVKHASQSVDIKEKMKLRNIEKYGTTSPQQKHIGKSNIEILHNKDKLVEFINQVDFEFRTVWEVSKLLNCTYQSLSNYSHQYNIWDEFNHKLTNGEGLLTQLLNELNIEYVLHDRHVLDSNEIDIYIPKYNMGIEFNGNYWHSSYNKSSSYHRDKSLLAKRKNVFLFHLWEYELENNKIIQLLKSKLNIAKQKCYARKCEIREVSKKECDEFLNEYHLQNTCRGQKIRYGLYFNNELIQIMTFGKSRYDKNYEWELLRLCTHDKYISIGGAERLWKHFLKEQNPTNVISYCDFSKFSGEVYERLGMKLIKLTQPQKIWVKQNKFVNDSLLQQLGFDKLFNTNYGKGTSNRELMIKNHWLETYNCGQLKYSYERD